MKWYFLTVVVTMVTFEGEKYAYESRIAEGDGSPLDAFLRLKEKAAIDLKKGDRRAGALAYSHLINGWEITNEQRQEYFGRSPEDS